jgi:hydrogenase nickel incorporation protein HypA/HybF
MGVTTEILRAVLDASTNAGATRINTVHVTIGELTEIVPDALQFSWEALTPGTLAEGSTLVIRETGGRSVCLQCSEEFDHGRFDRRCTACGSFATKVCVGDELLIDDVDVDVPDDPATVGEE